MSDSNHTVTIEGWPLVIQTINGEQEPTILDEELAQRLGYDRPRKIRDLIKRYVEAGKLPGISRRPIVGRYEIRPGVLMEQKVDAYFLTEAEALYITAKSDTPEADAMLMEVIRVFMLARRGLLPNQQLMQQAIVTLAALPAQMAQQHQEMIALITRLPGQKPESKPRLDARSLARLREALGVFAGRRGMTKLAAFQIVRREQHVQRWADLNYEQAEQVRAWMLQEMPDKAPVDMPKPDVDRAIDAIEKSTFVRRATETYNGTVVLSAKPPFYTLEEVQAEVNQRLKTSQCLGSTVPETWVLGQIQDVGLVGPRWIHDGKYSADVVDWIAHLAMKRHAKDMGAPAPWAGK